MRRHRSFPVCLLFSISALLISLPVRAASGPEDYELLIKRKSESAVFDDEKTWKEVETVLPKPPTQEGLVQIDVRSLSTNTFFVDQDSVEFGRDGVIRYTMVVISPSGARNVTYEGMRCGAAEKRLYAFGRADGTWSPAKSANWQRIEGGKLNQQHAALYREYFCTSGGSVSSTDEARRVLRNGNPAAAKQGGQ